MIARILAPILALLWSAQGVCQTIDVDWRTTAAINQGIDCFQTIKFTKAGYRELNPFVSPLLERKKYAEYLALNVGLALTLDDLGKRNKELYKWWAIAEMVAVWKNRKHGGFPVIWFKIK